MEAWSTKSMIETLPSLRLSKFTQHGVYRIEGCVYLFSDLIAMRRGRECQRMGSNRFHCTRDKNVDKAIRVVMDMSMPLKVA